MTLLRLFRLSSALLLRTLGARRHRLEVAGGVLRYHTVGPIDGEPWLLLHGLGTTGASWAPVVKALAGECRLVIPELSAIGGSEVPGGAVDLDRAPEYLTALIDAEWGPKARVTACGISLGAWMAVLLARQHPDRVARLVLVDAAGYGAQDWERIGRQVSLTSKRDTHELLAALWARVPWYLQLGAGAFYKVYTSEAVARILATTREDHAYWDADLAQLRIPTAVLWGERDGLFTVDVGERIAAALPDAQLTVFPGCGHVPPWESPQELNRALAAFRRSRP